MHPHLIFNGDDDDWRPGFTPCLLTARFGRQFLSYRPTEPIVPFLCLYESSRVLAISRVLISHQNKGTYKSDHVTLAHRVSSC
jgi:hypothetical protein